MNDLAIPILVTGPIAVTCGLFLVFGPHPAGYAPRRRRAIGGRPSIGAVMTALGITVIVLMFTGWLLPSIVLGIGVVVVFGSTAGDRSGTRVDIERLEAVALWIENLRDVLVAGEQPLGAVIATASRSPLPIRTEVRRLARGLTRYEPAVVLERFADEIDDPVGDLVATGLRVAIERGGRTAAVLDTLADHARHSTDRRRLIDAERAPIIREVGLVTWIMVVLLVGILFAGRSGYLSVYGTPTGQIVLSAALVAYGSLVIRVRHLARFDRPRRLRSPQERR